jgi:hypothetical protein
MAPSFDLGCQNIGMFVAATVVKPFKLMAFLVMETKLQKGEEASKMNHMGSFFILMFHANLSG